MAYREATLPVANGGTGQITLTNHGVLLGAGTSAVGAAAAGATGTILIGATGADPSFSATPTVTSITFGSGTALANYVEGTWTPVLVGETTTGTTTYTSQNGYYTRIGNIVFLYGTIVITGATGTGNAIIDNLPFTIKNQTNGIPTGQVIFSATGWSWGTSQLTMRLRFITNTTNARLNCNKSSGGAQFTQVSNAAATVIFSGAYQI